MRKRAEKTQVFGKKIRKKIKNVLAVFFQNFACDTKNLAKKTFKYLRRARDNNLVDLKKVDKIFDIF